MFITTDQWRGPWRHSPGPLEISTACSVSTVGSGQGASAHDVVPYGTAREIGTHTIRHCFPDPVTGNLVQPAITLEIA